MECEGCRCCKLWLSDCQDFFWTTLCVAPWTVGRLFGRAASHLWSAAGVVADWIWKTAVFFRWVRWAAYRQCGLGRTLFRAVALVRPPVPVVCGADHEWYWPQGWTGRGWLFSRPRRREIWEFVRGRVCWLVVDASVACFCVADRVMSVCFWQSWCVVGKGRECVEALVFRPPCDNFDFAFLWTGNVSNLSALFFEHVHCDSSESPLNLIEAVVWIDRA